MPHRSATDAALPVSAEEPDDQTYSQRPALLVRLLRDHVEVRRKLSALEAEVDRVAQYRKPDGDALIAAMAYFADYMSPQHHRIENLVYSALTRRAPFRAAEIDKIAAEHDEVHTVFTQCQDAAQQLLANPDGARFHFCRVLRGFIAFERHHIRREEGAFFVYAREYLTPADWDEITVAAGKFAPVAG
ncbi:MAG: hemerythrin domain-containing protein [Hyphomicrobium sp.]